MQKGFSFDLTTLVTDDKRVEEYEKQLAEDERIAKQKGYEASGVPEKFWKESFETFSAESEKDKAVYDKVKQFSEKPANRVLILCGENGNGKSHLASAVTRVCGGEYILSSMLCVKYDSATGYKADMTREQILLHYSKIKMLVIDECCKYFLDENLEKFLLMQIIIMRYENNLPTVLVTNANKQAFIQFLGKAVYDRFTEVCTTVEFDGASKRKGLRNDTPATTRVSA